jgi:lysophospholipid acyltransferase 1/2
MGGSPREMIDSWNHQTAVWLKFYVHDRTAKQYIPTLVTFMVSAFWHGFYPIYYIFFIQAYLMTEAARAIFRNRAKFHFIPEMPRYIIAK